MDALNARFSNINKLLNTLWVVICTLMVLLSQVGYMMKETGSIKMENNNVVLLKTILVISVSSITFFSAGYGFSVAAKGGLFGDNNFFGIGYVYQDYLNFIFYVGLCVKMAVIATGSIAERTNISTYVFFSFLNSGLIFPVGLAWCWNDGWLQNFGFIDYGGASVVHIMGGIAGFLGTLIIGPRIGLYHQDTTLKYLLDTGDDVDIDSDIDSEEVENTIPIPQPDIKQEVKTLNQNLVVQSPKEQKKASIKLNIMNMKKIDTDQQPHLFKKQSTLTNQIQKIQKKRHSHSPVMAFESSSLKNRVHLNSFEGKSPDHSFQETNLSKVKTENFRGSVYTVMKRNKEPEDDMASEYSMRTTFVVKEKLPSKFHFPKIESQSKKVRKDDSYSSHSNMSQILNVSLGSKKMEKRDSSSPKDNPDRYPAKSVYCDQIDRGSNFKPEFSEYTEALEEDAGFADLMIQTNQKFVRKFKSNSHLAIISEPDKESNKDYISPIQMSDMNPQDILKLKIKYNNLQLFPNFHNYRPESSNDSSLPQARQSSSHIKSNFLLLSQKQDNSTPQELMKSYLDQNPTLQIDPKIKKALEHIEPSKMDLKMPSLQKHMKVFQKYTSELFSSSRCTSNFLKELKRANSYQTLSKKRVKKQKFSKSVVVSEDEESVSTLMSFQIQPSSDHESENYDQVGPIHANVTVNEQRSMVTEKDDSKIYHQKLVLKKLQIRQSSLQRFKAEYPVITRNLSNSQIFMLFELYRKNCKRQFYVSNISFLVAGTLIILITSLFMNAGAELQILHIEPLEVHDANQIVMNTIISSASSGLFICLSNQLINISETQHKIAKTQLLMRFNVHTLCNGVLAGLVSVSASCANIDLWSASIIGLIGSMVYTSTRKLVMRFEIDDPLDITEIHGFCGIWSVIAVGIFDKDKGLLYKGSLNQILIQLLGAVSYALWSGLLSLIFFSQLKANQRLRAGVVFETCGLDFRSSKLGEIIDIVQVQRYQIYYYQHNQNKVFRKK